MHDLYNTADLQGLSTWKSASQTLMYMWITSEYCYNAEYDLVGLRWGPVFCISR